MILETGEYTLDRAALVNYAEKTMHYLAKLQMKNDIIKGGEYILTAQDLLEYIVAVPVRLLNEKTPEGYILAHHSIITLTYKQD
jgi:hypothetical protein